MKRYPFVFLLMICCGGAVATQLHARPVNPAVTDLVLDLDGGVEKIIQKGTTSQDEVLELVRSVTQALGIKTGIGGC